MSAQVRTDYSALDDVALARLCTGRDRQAMLATMVLQGMNRVIIDDGQIEASMDLAVDARSTAEQTTAERLDTRVTTSASGSFGMGVWGASASLSATVGYVKSDEQFYEISFNHRIAFVRATDVDTVS